MCFMHGAEGALTDEPPEFNFEIQSSSQHYFLRLLTQVISFLFSLCQVIHYRRHRIILGGGNIHCEGVFKQYHAQIYPRTSPIC
jgi:hypothetical protein